MGEAFHNSIVEFVFSGGLLGSSLVVGVCGGMKRRFLMISLGIAVLGIASWAGGILPENGFWGFVVLCFIMGGSGTLFNVPLMAYIQETTAPEVMGKVFSFFMTANMVAMPFGLLIAGPVSEAIGVDKWFLWSGVIMTIVGIICYFVSRQYDKIKVEVEKINNIK
jgi:DHA3 family macrolide efflux protein-like MFS transporter